MWARLEDTYPEHPKMWGLSHGAFRLHTSAVCFCARHLTDGRIERDRIPQLMPRYRPVYLRELVDRGALEERGDGDYDVHDFLDFNFSRVRWRARQDKAAARKKTWRDRQEHDGD